MACNVNDFKVVVFSLLVVLFMTGPKKSWKNRGKTVLVLVLAEETSLNLLLFVCLFSFSLGPHASP